MLTNNYKKLVHTLQIFTMAVDSTLKIVEFFRAANANVACC